ncbi:MAG TPA: DUF4383 domain-containing protein [Acidimicrobiales bacterium]|nr:DUF4383 domain-containing protein [Acidimicrobiales bacterium]
MSAVRVENTNKHLPLSYNQMFGYIFAIVYLAVGFAGFAATKGVDFTARVGGRELHWFSVNPLHNLVHLAVGTLFLVSAFAGPAASRRVNLLVGAVYLALGLVGPLVVGSSANILGLNLPDHLLHLVTGVTALTVAIVLGSRDELQVA